MANTIIPGDHIFVKQRAFGPIIRGNIVVFRYPNDTSAYLGRIVGLPEEDIQVRGRSVFIDGTKLQERIVNVEDWDAGYDHLTERGTEADGPYSVFYGVLADHSSDTPFASAESFHIPKNDYFIMGDNRDNSEDSRYRGPVKQNDILGKPILIYWSTRHSINPANEKTRWERIGMRLR